MTQMATGSMKKPLPPIIKPAPALYAYSGTSNQLAGIEGEFHHAFTYTENGDLATETGDKDKTFTYDARNRNSVLSTRDDHGDGGATYAYNALGERVSKDVDSRQTHFIYDEQGHPIAEADSFNGITKEYIYMNDLPIAELDGNEVYYIHADHLGTPQKMTDEQQKIVWSRVAEPFGETFSITGPATLHLRFPGQYCDSESGLDYNGLRTKMGPRYTQSDPIGLLGGINTYSYVGQNPIRGIDPFGLQEFFFPPEEELMSPTIRPMLPRPVPTGSCPKPTPKFEPPTNPPHTT